MCPFVLPSNSFAMLLFPFAINVIAIVLRPFAVCFALRLRLLCVALRLRCLALCSIAFALSWLRWSAVRLWLRWSAFNCFYVGFVSLIFFVCVSFVCLQLQLLFYWLNPLLNQWSTNSIMVPWSPRFGLLSLLCNIDGLQYSQLKISKWQERDTQSLSCIHSLCKN